MSALFCWQQLTLASQGNPCTLADSTGVISFRASERIPSSVMPDDQMQGTGGPSVAYLPLRSWPQAHRLHRNHIDHWNS